LGLAAALDEFFYLLRWLKYLLNKPANLSIPDQHSVKSLI